MNVMLNQDKLNGTSKKGISVFNWRGQFNLDFVKYILNNFANNTSMVCDPFSGSGTVLYECAIRNIKCVGMDINPSAYYMSKFFSYANMDKASRERLIENVRNKIKHVLSEEKNFEKFTKKIGKVSFKEELYFVINVVFIASKSKNLNKNTDENIWKAFEYVGRQMATLPMSNNLIDVYLKDARELAENGYKNKFDLIFTSPPYINVFNYHQNYRNAVELLGWNVLDIAQSEIGSNRKNRGNRFKTVVQYCTDMSLVLKGFWNALKETGVVVIVIGKTSSVRGIEFHNGAIIKDLIAEMKSFIFKECYERSFKNKFGKEIFEDIIVFKKDPNISHNKDIARRVAEKHLLRALETVGITDEIYSSIQKTIDEIQDIKSSPILTIKGCDLSEYIEY